MSRRRMGAAALAVALAVAGCAENGGSGATTAVPPPAPTPTPEPPPPPPPSPPPEPPPAPTVTWIGFVPPATAELSAGRRIHVWITVAGEPLTTPLLLFLDHAAPAGTLVLPSAVEVDERGHATIEIERPPVSEVEAASQHEIVLRAPEGGLPPGVALNENWTRFRLTLPAAEPPPPPAVTWIGFAPPATAELFAGSRVRVSVTAAGEPLESAMTLDLHHPFPAGALDVPSEVRVERHGHGIFEIERRPTSGFEAASRHEISLRAPEEGLPPGIGLSQREDRFRVTLPEADPHDCSALHLSATSERFDQRDGLSSARLLLEGPANVAVRFIEPYWEERLEAWDEPPELPIPLSDVAPVPLFFPDAMPYRSGAGRSHSQRVSLAWYRDLEVEAVAPGCAPVRLRCPVETILTRGCRGG